MAEPQQEIKGLSLEDTLGDSDADHDDADQVGKDIDAFESRLRGEAQARAAPVKVALKPAAAKTALPVLTKVKALGPFSKAATEEELEASEARAAVEELAGFDKEHESP
mmetsp:Transcript_32699/g.81318  ORF Transcript_32699/g.81318 Transcript_32699/m.81318 type:complete len:109 (-) Transcript_32699:447-773(-)